ncbi:hypothetical protein DXB41_09245 [Segatella copri]|nr:hypothetical protein DXB41_09245 [Segatella copri]
MHANLRVFVEIELGNHLFGGGKSLKIEFQTPVADELPAADDEGSSLYLNIYNRRNKKQNK